MRRLRLAAGLALIGVSLFLPAGTIAWPGAWIFLGLFVGGLFATMGWLRRHDPALFEQRTRAFRQPGQPSWDKAIGLALMVVWYVWLVLMGFDMRWSGGRTPVWLLTLGAALIVAGYLLTVASFKANTFATVAVRLQTERGQTVIDCGPYAWVRHPIYSASLAIHVGTALLLGARWGLLGLPVLAFLLGLRAVLEESTLRHGLPGYCDYMAKVRYRLLPAIW